MNRHIDFATQVRVGHNPETDFALSQTYAITIARQLAAAGRWDGRGTLTVHNPVALFVRLQRTLVERHDPAFDVLVYQGIHALQPGADFEVTDERGEPRHQDIEDNSL